MGTIATIGFFDGVHRGHQLVLKRLVEEAKRHDSQSMVVTFSNHPKQDMPLLNTLDERIERIKQQGVDSIQLLQFEQVKHLTAKEFMQEMLIEKLHVDCLLMGYDHRFGSDQITDFRIYQAIADSIGLKVINLPQYAPHGHHISSSTIRTLIDMGEIDDANQLLGYNYSIEGHVVEGRHIGRQLGFPTANITPLDEKKLIVGAGVYVARVYSAHEQNGRLGMLNVGTNPTVGGSQNTIEVHILDFDKQLYGEKIKIEIIHRLRGEIKFNTLDQLRRQLEKDKQQCLNYKL